jgi:hypothetical protein
VEVRIDLIGKLKIGKLFLVGRGLGTTLLLNVDTPPSSPSLNRIETNQRKLSTSSSPSRTSSDDDSSITYKNGIATQTNYRSSSSTHLPVFKMISTSGNICPRCTKTVYSAEEVKAAGKVILFCFTNRKILFLDIS